MSTGVMETVFASRWHAHCLHKGIQNSLFAGLVGAGGRANAIVSGSEEGRHRHR